MNPGSHTFVLSMIRTVLNRSVGKSFQFFTLQAVVEKRLYICPAETHRVNGVATHAIDDLAFTSALPILSN